MRFRLGAIFLLFSVIVAAASTGLAQDSGILIPMDASVSREASENETSFWVAFRPSDPVTFTLWYDAITDPGLSWHLPDGIQKGESLWPEVLKLGQKADGTPVLGFGPEAWIYQKFEAEAGWQADGSEDITLDIDRLSICEDSCQTWKASFTFNVSESLARASELSEDELEKIRKSGLRWRKGGLASRITKDYFYMGVVMDRSARDAVKSAILMPLSPDVVDAGAPLEFSPTRNGLFGRSKPAADVAPPDLFEGLFAVVGKAGDITAFYFRDRNDQTLIMGEDAFVADDGQSGANDGFNIPRALLFALIGGMILNIMPCVFPVLALKSFGLVQAGSHSSRAMRADGLAYTAGVVLSFLIVAALLIFIRSLGNEVGWGFQLQSPGFVLAMAIIMFVVGLSFLGVFELGTGFAGLGSRLASAQGPKGAFFTGGLATLVATPCTAPFMAASIGFALAQSGSSALMVFASLGFGMALPYLALSFAPGLARRLPKPGAWMVTFKEFLAFPMFATVVWLLWVLNRQTRVSGLLVALGIMVALGFGFWLIRKLPDLARARPLVIGAMFLAVVFSVARIGDFRARESSVDDLSFGMTQTEVVSYSEETLTRARLEGHPVFLHFYASWCIFCLMSENLVFSTDDFQAYLNEKDIVFMYLDNTLESPGVSRMMESYGRPGQPLDVYFPADASRPGKALPTAFTTQTAILAMKAIDQAG